MDTADGTLSARHSARLVPTHGILVLAEPPEAGWRLCFERANSR
jgi:hypothetical protein